MGASERISTGVWGVGASERISTGGEHGKGAMGGLCSSAQGGCTSASEGVSTTMGGLCSGAKGGCTSASEGISTTMGEGHDDGAVGGCC